MYRLIEDFVGDWTAELELTEKIFSNLTDESLDQRVTGEGRSIGELAWHITTSIGEVLHRTGIMTEGPEDNSTVPDKAEVIKEAYGKAARSAAEEIKKNWDDSKLMEEVDMYGEMWKNGLTLSVLVVHQIHHRAQITVLMRQAGLKVPGIYGPSKEEWAAMGMPAAK